MLPPRRRRKIFQLGLALVALAACSSATVAAEPKSSFDITEGEVVQVFSARSEGHRFIAYSVKWNDDEIIVTDSLAKSDHKPGDTVRFMVHKQTIPNALGGVSILGFMLIDRGPLKGHAEEPVSKKESDRTQRLVAGDLEVAETEIERFYGLNRAAKKALAAGKKRLATEYAKELLELAAKHKDDWNYGNAIQDGNQILGRIALEAGNVDQAKKRLLASADSEGSPQMNSFGPNMQLAKELLAAGEKESVLEYFELCGAFWEMGQDKLADWSALVKNGRTPDFGGNLKY